MLSARIIMCAILYQFTVDVIDTKTSDLHNKLSKYSEEKLEKNSLSIERKLYQLNSVNSNQIPYRSVNPKLQVKNIKGDFINNHLLDINDNKLQSTLPVTNRPRLLPRPVLYKLGFVTLQPLLIQKEREVEERIQYLYKENHKNTMISTLTLILVSFGAGLITITIASILFLLHRRRVNSTGSQVEADRKTAVEVIGADINNVLSAVPDEPLSVAHLDIVTDCQQAGLGQIVLGRCLSTYSTLTHSEQDFISQFSDVIGQDGGEVESPYSDVSVKLQPNTFDSVQQVFVNVALSASNITNSAVHDTTEQQLSPIVEFYVACLMQKNAIVSLPCSAAQNIDIKVRYSDNKKQWIDVSSDSYEVKEGTVNVRTSGSGLFVVTGKRSIPTQMSISAWANESAKQTYYRVYCHHNTRDSQKRISEMEKVFAGKLIGQSESLIIPSISKELHVSLHCGKNITTKSINVNSCREFYDPPSLVNLSCEQSTPTMISFCLDGTKFGTITV